MNKVFPKDFKWGVATSAYQIEGGNNFSDWALWEEKMGIEKAGKACNSYIEYEKDIELLKKLNLNTYRFSIEWSRIEPKEGEWNLEALDYYKSLLKKLKIEGIEPFVTLFHYSLPQWVSEYKSFETKKIINYFKRFTEFVVENLGMDVKYWITINEPTVYASLGYISKQWPPGKKSYIKYFRVIKNLELSHIVSYKKINEIYKKYGWDKPSISIAQNNNDMVGKDIPSKIYIYFLKRIFSYSFLNKVKDYIDFIGLNVYFYTEIEFSLFKGFSSNLENKLPENDVKGWKIHPLSMYSLVKDVYNRYKKDIYITENGISLINDEKRGIYIKEYLEYLFKAIEEGIPVKGYFYWTLVDNFEWLNGYKAKFGLCYLDESNKRVIKNSGKYYASIVKRNSID